MSFAVLYSRGRSSTKSGTGEATKRGGDCPSYGDDLATFRQVPRRTRSRLAWRGFPNRRRWASVCWPNKRANGKKRSERHTKGYGEGSSYLLESSPVRDRSLIRVTLHQIVTDAASPMSVCPPPTPTWPSASDYRLSFVTQAQAPTRHYPVFYQETAIGHSRESSSRQSDKFSLIVWQGDQALRLSIWIWCPRAPDLHHWNVLRQLCGGEGGLLVGGRPCLSADGTRATLFGRSHLPRMSPTGCHPNSGTVCLPKHACGRADRPFPTTRR